MTIGPDNPIAGRVDHALDSTTRAQQAAEQRSQQRQRIEPAEESAKPRVSDEERRQPQGPISLTGPSSSDVQREVANYARTIPPPEDLLAIQASANTFALINLDAAKEIARGMREAVESGDSASVRTLQDALFSDTTARDEVAEALTG